MDEAVPNQNILVSKFRDMEGGSAFCILKISCATTMTVIVVVQIADWPGTKENNFIW